MRVCASLYMRVYESVSVCIAACTCIYVLISAHVRVHTYRGHIVSPHEHGIPGSHARPTADYNFTPDLTGRQAVGDD